MADSVILVTVNNDFSDVKGLKAKIIDPAEYLREDHKIKKGGCRMKSIITSENECVFASCKIFRQEGNAVGPRQDVSAEEIFRQEGNAVGPHSTVIRSHINQKFVANPHKSKGSLPRYCLVHFVHCRLHSNQFTCWIGYDDEYESE